MSPEVSVWERGSKINCTFCNFHLKKKAKKTSRVTTRHGKRVHEGGQLQKRQGSSFLPKNAKLPSTAAATLESRADCDQNTGRGFSTRGTCDNVWTHSALSQVDGSQVEARDLHGTARGEGPAPQTKG